MMMVCCVGVKGLVRDELSLAPVAAATVAVSGRLHTTQTTAGGEFWRLLLPGAYVINVSSLLTTLYSCVPWHTNFYAFHTHTHTV